LTNLSKIIDISTSSTALLTNLDAALREDDPTASLLDPEDLELPVEALEDELPVLEPPDERPGDLLDLDLDLSPPLLEEAPDKLPVLDLVTQLLSLSTAPDLDTEDADFLEADLDNSSRNLEEELDTSLDEDDEANLES
jgi:hypothetical protein